MDNLEKLWCHSVTTNEIECGKTISCSYAEDIACFISEKNYLCTYHHHKLSSTGAAKKISGNGKLKRVHYLSFYDTIFASTDFDLYIFGRHTFQIKFYFVTPKPISELCWNPTETTLAVTFDSDEIALYNFSGCQFELGHIADLQGQVSNSVYVGWGSHNTQFQAPRAQDPVEVEAIPICDGPPKIVWRSQGEQLAVNFHKNGKRFIKVFDKELNALYMTEEYINLGCTVSFMALGQCIASSAVRNKVNTVVIFEKNCKVKSTFDVPENKGVIKKLEYHPHMNMLAVYSIDEEDCGYINIYLNVNARWYLKNQLYFPPNREVRDFQWVNMPEAAYTISKIVVFTSKNIEYHTFRFIINRSPKISLVATIDGKNIEFYNFFDKIIPPPLKVSTMTFNRPVNQILFHPKNSFAIVLDSKLQGYIIDVHNYTKVLNTDDLNLPHIACFHNIEWGLPNTGNKMQINVAYNSKEARSTTKEHSGLILHIKTFEMTNPQYVLPYNDTEALVSHKILKDRFCSLMYLTQRIVKIEDVNNTLDFSVSSNNEFYVNEKLVYCGVTSLYIYKKYMLFTTINAKLYCTRLLEDTSLFDKEMDLSKLYSRDVEQGARIITASDNDVPQIILHIPRGNLEIICCKLMAVDVIEGYLDSSDWKSAIELMRTTKINWNVLIDLNPHRFLVHTPEFVQAAEHCSMLTTIVNEFGSADRSYLSYMPTTANVCHDKTHSILKILEYLTSTNCVANLTSIVSIQQKHVSLKAALNSIKEVFEVQTDKCEAACKKALQYLLIKTHFKDILSAGYSFYNLYFLKFIYSNSAQDPRVFEPEIEDLKQLDSVDLRFQMSLKANNPKVALKYLMRCLQYDADYIEAFIVKYKLEAYAYTILPSYIRFYSMIANLYAKQLSQQRKHSEAAFILKKAKMFPEALEEYKQALDWMEVVALINQLEYEEDEKKKILYDLSEKLVRAHKLDEAVILVEHYIKDYNAAIEMLVTHKAFKRAFGLARIYGCAEAMEELIIPHVKLHIMDLSEKFDDFRSNFEKYLRRLKIVRESKKISLDNQGPGDNEPDDVFSETDSTSSGSSRGTSRTRGSSLSSRNRRKEERKKIDLREGGHYEDIALMRALYLLYTDVFSMGQEVREICLIVEHSLLSMVKPVYMKLWQLEEDMKKEIALIWPEAFLILPHVVDNYTLAVVENKADLDPQYWRPPPDELLNAKWKLEMFHVVC